MTRVQYERARNMLGKIKLRARRAHAQRRFADRDRACREHDDLMLRLLEGLS